MATRIRYVLIALVLLCSCNRNGRGCIDSMANNLDASAIENDGSCTYDSLWVESDITLELSDILNESSGLIFWDGHLWTHNDNTDTKLYGLDPGSAAIKREYQLTGVLNTDWEEISQDAEFIYVGDFGNNASGNRIDLHILRIDKESLVAGNAIIDTIWFSYSDQLEFGGTTPNQTEFDCEAFVVSHDSIFLFTKQWLTAKTSLYAMPKVPGNHKAQKRATLDIKGLVTGACYLEAEKLLVLSGYDILLNPFVFLMYDYSGYHFFSGNKRKIFLSIPFSQVEGVATEDGLIYYISNEKTTYHSLIETRPAIHRIDLTEYLKEYLK